MPTVTQMEARARARADQDGSTFPTSPQYQEFLSDGAEELWNKMVAAGGKPAQTAVTVVTSGASSYTIGTNVMMVLSVERVDGVNRLPLRRVQEEYLPYLRSLPANFAEYYDLVGGAVAALSLELFPNPGSGSYIVRYVPRFTRFTAGSDNWYGPPRSDEYIILYAARSALRKEGDPAKDLDDELAAIYADVCRMAPWQDAQNPGVIRDTRVFDATKYRPFDDFRVKGVDDI